MKMFILENHLKHEVRWTVNGKRKDMWCQLRRWMVISFINLFAIIRDRYNVQSEFCGEKDTGKKIIELLGRKDE